VSREDLALITLAGVQEPYAALRLSELNDSHERLLHSGDVASSIRQYLYQKYVYRSSAEPDVPAPLRLAVSGGAT
jgi:hypothetical protein